MQRGRCSADARSQVYKQNVGRRLLHHSPSHCWSFRPTHRSLPKHNPDRADEDSSSVRTLLLYTCLCLFFTLWSQAGERKQQLFLLIVITRHVQSSKDGKAEADKQIWRGQTNLTLCLSLTLFSVKKKHLFSVFVIDTRRKGKLANLQGLWRLVLGQLLFRTF